jgi:hypothetical protein
MANRIHKEEKIIEEILKSLGSWANEVVIGGGYALLIYRLCLSKNTEPMPAATRDVDSLIPRIVGKKKTELAKVLKSAGFEHQFKDDGHPPTESYIKEIHGEEIELEFLTDDRVRKNRGKNIEISGVVAQPLSYLEMSLENVTEFSTKNKLRGKVVSPGAWAFHKALTFPRRRDKIKAKKDLYGFWFVFRKLDVISDGAMSEIIELMKANPAWAKTMRKNLKTIDDWSPKEWEVLEVQDPSGELSKNGFKELLKNF